MTERDLERKREEERAPVEEAGGGEAEGFEQAEEQLERNASHEDSGANPRDDAFTPEVESDLSGAEYGEADGEGEEDRSDPDQATGHPENAG